MLWSLLREVVRTAMRHRVTGLAAEGAFFAVLSLPPLVFGLAGSVGYVLGAFGPATVERVKSNLVDVASQALTTDSVQQVIVPTLDAVLDDGRFDVLSIGFLLALWSGSRALHVVIDGLTIMYGKGDERGIVKARLLSLATYVVGLCVGVVALPLVLAGPELVAYLLPDQVGFLGGFYWPAVIVLSTGLVAAFYALARPGSDIWRLHIPGALIAMVIWIAGSLLLRLFLTYAIGGASIYGPLAAPIVVLLWLYLIVLALLIGAAFNATLDARRHRS